MKSITKQIKHIRSWKITRKEKKDEFHCRVLFNNMRRRRHTSYLPISGTSFHPLPRTSNIRWWATRPVCISVDKKNTSQGHVAVMLPVTWEKPFHELNLSTITWESHKKQQTKGRDEHLHIDIYKDVYIHGQRYSQWLIFQCFVFLERPKKPIRQVFVCVTFVWPEAAREIPENSRGRWKWQRSSAGITV